MLMMMLQLLGALDVNRGNPSLRNKILDLFSRIKLTEIFIALSTCYIIRIANTNFNLIIIIVAGYLYHYIALTCIKLYV